VAGPGLEGPLRRRFIGPGLFSSHVTVFRFPKLFTWQVKATGSLSVSELFILRSPGQAPYGTKPACAKRGTYPDPPP
jgi:hypothetical protein